MPPVILAASQDENAAGLLYIVRGEGEPGEVLAVQVDGSTTTTVTVDADGSWAAPVPFASPGTFSLAVMPLGEADGTNALGAPAQFEIQVEAATEAVAATPTVDETAALPAAELPATGRGADETLLPILLIVGGLFALLAALSLWDARRQKLLR
jgi:hypothetical protein